MSLKIPRFGLVFLVVNVVFAIALTLWLLTRLGGPGISIADRYEVTASFDDVQQLETKAVALVRGVKVGTVKAIDVDGDRAEVRLEIEDRYAPFYRDATARIGQRTAVGDAFVDLRRGTPDAGSLPDGARIRRVRASVTFDEAFTTLDPPARADAVALVETFGRGARSAETADRWNATVHQLSRVVQELRAMTGTLRDQEGEIAGLVSGSRVVLRELGSREQALASLVADGRSTLETFASRPRQLAAGLRELPELLRSTRNTLAHARPLLVEAQPLVDDLSAASPELQATFRDLRPTAAAARRAIGALPRFNRAALPFLRRALPVVEVARPFARRLTPNLQNLVPSIRYLAPRAPELAAWFSNTFAPNRDSKGNWVRFMTFVEPSLAHGLPNGQFGRNAYPAPGDAANPLPYEPGSYPRLMPFEPEGR